MLSVTRIWFISFSLLSSNIFLTTCNLIQNCSIYPIIILWIPLYFKLHFFNAILKSSTIQALKIKFMQVLNQNLHNYDFKISKVPLFGKD